MLHTERLPCRLSRNATRQGSRRRFRRRSGGRRIAARSAFSEQQEPDGAVARNGVVMKHVSAERAGAFELIQEADQGYGNRVSVDTISRRNDKIELELAGIKSS